MQKYVLFYKNIIILHKLEKKYVVYKSGLLHRLLRAYAVQHKCSDTKEPLCPKCIIINYLTTKNKNRIIGIIIKFLLIYIRGTKITKVTFLLENFSHSLSIKV